MSAYSTLYVTRRKALSIMLRPLLETLEGNITDDQLEEFMDKYLEDRLYNCVIVGNDETTNDDEYV